ncbi:MAG: hypothetical protein E3J72_15740 [Planctomycetota bacterium]|nr:MAG: hypothetical protein E3J72_15740 [Planctomycetota bacterium]
MVREACKWVLVAVMVVAVSCGCSMFSGKTGQKSSRGKSSRKKTKKRKSRLASRSSTGSKRSSRSRKSRSDRKPLADVDKPSEPARPELKEPAASEDRPEPIAEKELTTLTERRSQIAEYEKIPIPKMRDFSLSIYYQTGEILVPEDKRSAVEKREPHQAVVKIAVKSGGPVFYLNGARVPDIDALGEKLKRFREDVLKGKYGHENLEPQVLVEADRHVPYKYVETVFSACFIARIKEIQSVINPIQRSGGK